MRSKQGGRAPLPSSASASQRGLRFAFVCLRPFAPLIQWLRHPIRGACLLRLLRLRFAPVSSAFAPRQGCSSPLLSICIYICNLHLPIVYIAKFTSVNPNGYAGCALRPRYGDCNTVQQLRSTVPLRPPPSLPSSLPEWGGPEAVPSPRPRPARPRRLRLSGRLLRFAPSAALAPTSASSSCARPGAPPPPLRTSSHSPPAPLWRGALRSARPYVLAAPYGSLRSPLLLSLRSFVARPSSLARLASLHILASPSLAPRWGGSR